MRRSDRLARLQELLARVQRNTAERRGEVAIISAATGVAAAPPTNEATPAPRAHLEAIPPPPASPTDLGNPDDWSSLLTRELADPNPLGDTTGETSFPSLVPPDPPPPSDPEALVAMRESLAPVEPPIEPAPESNFEHALRIAAEQRPEPPDPRALWLEAADELRERRITVPPEDDPAPEHQPAPSPPPPALSEPPPATTTPIPASRRSVRPTATEPHSDTPTPIATFETTHSAAPRASDSHPGRVGKPRESVAPSPLSRRRRLPRPSPTPIVMGESPPDRPTPYWAVVLLGCGVGLLFTLAYIAFRAFDQPRAVAQSVPNTTLMATTAVVTTASQLPAHVESSAPVIEVGASAPPASPSEPIPAITRPKTMGLLWVDSTTPVRVYVQGLEVGFSGAYLEVPCGLKNVRLARRDLPPPGHSFPMWLGRAESVLVPCGAANRVKMSAE